MHDIVQWPESKGHQLVKVQSTLQNLSEYKNMELVDVNLGLNKIELVHRGYITDVPYSI